MLHAARVARGQADVVLGCDLMVCAGPDALATMTRERTHAIINTDVAPTGTFTRDADWQAKPEQLLERVRQGTAEVCDLEATRLATALMGDAVATNVFVLGYAWQKGWIPLEEASLMQAIQINGAAVAMNRTAFAWGRQAALDLGKVRAAAGLKTESVILLTPQRLPSLDQLVEDRSRRLAEWQNAAYADKYATFVREIARTEFMRTGTDRFSREVAVSLYKLMAYKDEYEVARLHTETGFLEGLKDRFDGNFSPRFHMAPPLFAKKDDHGHLIKKSYGPWMVTAMRWLAKGRVLRGTVLDPFGYTAERRAERAAAADFQALIQKISSELDVRRQTVALELARLPQTVRGFGHVKERNAEAARAKQAELLNRWEQEGQAPAQKAA